jgi:predicted AAA+ superfamily ATPase
MNVLPFSFLEMTKAVGGKVGDAAEKRRFMDYLTYGSLPESFAFKTGSSEQREYVESVYRTILEKDVLKRNKEGGRLLVGQMLKYMASAISSLTSPKRMADRLKANGVKVSANTVSSYLDILEDCYFIYKADRFDVKGGEMLKLINKYYLTDFGFRYYTLSNPDIEIQQLLENAVFLELLRRRYKVATGKVDEREVDFVVKGSNDLLCYIQVAVTVAEKEKYSQEVAAFKSIRDNYPKLILTLDDIFIENRNGIQTMNVIDFITGRCALPV